ncbi:MAG TPA: FadR/GntR family transcriptional regulator [Vicinamibacteria bacterium]|jgi:GntR family transcriptional repressor for pyruvate dehydrogenase complex
MDAAPPRSGSNPVAAEQVIAHVRALIEQGTLRPGDRLASERQLAHDVGISRPSVRAGLRSLATMGVVRTRRGAGTFITDGPPALDNEALGLLATLHGIGFDKLFEARRILEVASAALAAERATGDQVMAMSDEVTGMYAALNDPQGFLVHDVRFHQAVAAGANNPVVGALIEMVSSLHYEQRRATVERARDQLREGADLHRKIYHAIRARDPDAASAAMDHHLRRAQAALASEEAGPTQS